ncbi:MAG: esterase-like activity of phytase family protein [Planctomycetes bacterium]|nr:esterase-like activity of phytase family protein [Planctomycetota bacterium]
MAAGRASGRSGPRIGPIAVAAAACTVAVGQLAAVDRVGEPHVRACHVVPSDPLASGVRLGGLSDLALASTGHGGADIAVVWSIIDRGPNGTRRSGRDKRRTLLVPDFVPAMVRLRLPAEGTAVVEATLPLAGATGRPLSGRPNGVGRDEPILDVATGRPLASDPDGVDPEALVAMPDGSFWIAEEYRPSLVQVSVEGRVQRRHVPANDTLPGADAEVIADLPAAYGDRRDNRGFEGLALSSDGRRLYLLLQSPLEHPCQRSAATTGNVRILVCDAVTGTPVAEHVYRLGDPLAQGWADRGAPPEDGKLCCLAPLGDGTLLILEQDDTGLARLYRADPRSATDTLPATRLDAGPAVETVGDLEAAGIRPLAKRLVADLAPLVPRLRRDVFGDEGAAGDASLKLEGLVVLDDRRVLVCNDNDFAVPGSAAGGPDGGAARSCVWEIVLPAPLAAGGSLTATP